MNQGFLQRILFQSLFRRQNVMPRERFYGRWMHRNPAKIILPYEGSTLKREKIVDLDSEALRKSREAHAANLKKEIQILNSNEVAKMHDVEGEQEKDKSVPKISVNGKEIKHRRESQLIKKKVVLSKQKVFNENNDVIYDKLKDNDGRISTLLIKLKSKKDRARTGQVLVEGWRLIVDGIKAKCPLRYIIFSRSEDLNKLKTYLPETGVKIYKIPYKEIELWSDVETSPGIFGVFETPKIENIICRSKPLPINVICDNIRIPGNLGAILRACVGVGCEKVFLIKGCVDYWDSKVVRSASGAHFRLPVHTSVEWEQMPSLLESDTSIFIADNNSKVLLEDADNYGGENDNTSDIDNRLGQHIPVIPYYGVEFGSLKSITLIIGGETEGISEDSYRFAADRNGIRLNIPLQNGVDSLNTGMAVAVIAFEIKKQILQAKARVALNTEVRAM